ncbi:ferredoxin [Streptococcus suis]|nr:ferredoxin [Streptococcus suis]
MNIKLIPERCIACGLCQTFSDLFDYNDDGIVIFPENGGNEKNCQPTPEIMNAIKSCPTKAILSD